MSQVPEYEREVELIDYIEVLLARKWLIVAVTLVCGGVTWLSNLSGAQVYQSEALAVVSRPISEGQTHSDDDTEIRVPLMSAQTYEALAKADELLADLRDSLLHAELADDAAEVVQHTTIDGLSGMLVAEIVAATETADSPLLSFKVTSSSKAIAVPMANLWIRLFVRRHLGLSSNVADDYYRSVQEQYGTAKANLDSVEKVLKPLQVSHSRLMILDRDTRVRSARLSEALRRKQIQEISLDRMREELAYLNRSLGQVESQGNWIGFLGDDEFSRVAKQDRGSSDRSDLIELRRTFNAALAESLQISRAHDALRNQARNAGGGRRLDFERRRQPGQLRAKEAQITRSLDSFRTDLSRLEVDVTGRELEARVLLQNLEEEPRTQTVSKAIGDDDLWRQVTENGRPDTKLQERLGRYRLISESLSGTYQKLSERARAAKIAADLSRSRIGHLRTQIPELEETLAQTRQALAEIEGEENAMSHELSRDSVRLEERLMRQTLPVAERLSRTRSALTLLRDNYTEGKERQILLQQEISQLSGQLGYEQATVAKLGAQLQSQTTELDSLDGLRDRLTAERDIFQQSFERFSRLLEEARIAREQAAGDIQIVSDAVVARPVPRATVKKAVIAGVIGLMASTMLAFLLEYVARARGQQREQQAPTA